MGIKVYFLSQTIVDNISNIPIGNFSFPLKIIYKRGACQREGNLEMRKPDRVEEERERPFPPIFSPHLPNPT